jgi:hypothetical protein
MPGGEQATSRRRLWRALSAAPLPLLVGLWSLWWDLYTLDATGPQRTGGAVAIAEWALLSLLTVALVVSFWAPQRPIRVLGYTLYALLLSFAFGVAGVIAVVHAFGGPRGELAAPGWAIAALGLTSALCALALLAVAALIVDDVRATGEED